MYVCLDETHACCAWYAGAVPNHGDIHARQRYAEPRRAPQGAVEPSEVQELLEEASGPVRAGNITVIPERDEPHCHRQVLALRA